MSLSPNSGNNAKEDVGEIVKESSLLINNVQVGRKLNSFEEVQKLLSKLPPSRQSVSIVYCGTYCHQRDESQFGASYCHCLDSQCHLPSMSI